MPSPKSYSIEKIHKFRDGKLHIYKKSTMKNWMCRFFAEGRYKVQSTGETNLSTAKQMAMDWYDELRFNQKQGVPIHAIKFLSATEQFLVYQKSLVSRGERSERQAKDYGFRISMLNKFFANMEVSSIDTQKIVDYIEARTNLAKEPVKIKTVKYDLIALRLVLKYCILKKWIDALPLFPQTKREPTNPRPWFELDEWKKLLKQSRVRIKEAEDKKLKWQREQLQDFMVFMVHTGLRVSECLSLRYSVIKIKKKSDGTAEVNFEVKGKTGFRRVRGLVGAVRAYERLKKRNKGYKKTDLLFPKNHKDGLNSLLREANLKMDKQGRVRNSKSFRSTFIMFRLLANVSVDKIATNCGTSSTIIENYYAKYINIDMMGDSFTDLPE